MHANEPTSTPVPAPTDDTQSSADAADRRAFLKGAAVVAGVAATGVLAAAPEANAAIGRGLKATVRLSFRKEMILDDLINAITEVVDQAGCPTCGLNGFDIRLETIIPLKTEVPGVQAAIEDGTLTR